MTSVFNQYLRYTTIPELEFRKSGKVIEYKWKAEAPNFSMPVDVMIKGKKIRLEANTSWKVLSENVKSINDIQPIKTDFYIKY